MSEAGKRAEGARQQVERAIGAGRYLIAAWRIEGGRLILEPITYQDFPAGDYPEALKQLRGQFDRAIKPPTREPAQEASKEPADGDASVGDQPAPAR